MKRFLVLFLIVAIVLAGVLVLYFCLKKGNDNDEIEARLFEEDGLLAVRDADGYGFINKKGEEVVPCGYYYAERFRNGAATVWEEKDGKSYYIDVDGNRLCDRTFVSAYPFDEYDCAIVHSTNGGPAELINKKGETLFEAKWIEATGAGLYLFQNEDGKTGAVDRTGKSVLTPEYVRLDPAYRFELNEFGVYRYTALEDRLFAEVMNGETGNTVWNLIDYDGNVLYTFPENAESSPYYGVFGGNRMAANKGDGFDVIDLDGNVIVSRAGRVVEVNASYFAVDIADGSRDTIREHGQCILYDWSGEIVFDFRDSDYLPCEFGTNDFTVRDPETGKYGLINLKGETVVPVAYDSVRPGDANGYSVCRKDGAYSVVNRKGKTVFEKRCDYLVPSDYFQGKYYLACYKEGENVETYELLKPSGATVRTFGAEYSFGYFTPEGSPEPFGFEYPCGYFADGCFVVRDVASGTFVIMNGKFEVIIEAGRYDYLNLPTYYYDY